MTLMTRSLKVFQTSFDPTQISLTVLISMAHSLIRLFPLRIGVITATVLSVGKRSNNGIVRLKAGAVLPPDGQPPGTMMLRGHDAEVNPIVFILLRACH
jgi:hypothetical protein